LQRHGEKPCGFEGKRLTKPTSAPGLRRNAAVGAALLLAALTLGGCSMDLSNFGGPPEAARAKDPGDFPAVNDLPHNRDDTAMEPAERARIESELVAARNRQVLNEAQAKAPNAK
jgi:hypothetical protein